MFLEGCMAFGILLGGGGAAYDGWFFVFCLCVWVGVLCIRSAGGRVYILHGMGPPRLFSGILERVLLTNES